MTARIFDSCFKLLMENEGGFVDDPRDSGGVTKYGISKKAYPDVDIQSLTLQQAKEIYRKDYWNRCKCDYLPDCLCMAVFDYAVNSGTIRAIKDLQTSLGVGVDGIIGNQTIGAANRVPVKPVIEEICKRRLKFLMSLKGWKYYGNGWGSRVKRVQKFCEELV